MSINQPRYAAHRLFLTWNDENVTPLSLRTVRWLTVLAFGGFLLSRLIERLFADVLVAEGVGGLLALASSLALLLILSSRLQRLFFESDSKLDEYQRSKRNASLSSAYGIFSALVLSACLYVILALDWGWPLPTSRQTLGDIGHGLILLGCLLPVTILAWTLDLSEDPDGPQEEDA